MPHSARRGGVEVTGQAARPGRGWCTHARARGRTLDKQAAPAMAGPHTEGRGRCYLTLEMPQRCHTALAGAGWKSAGRLRAPVVAGVRTAGREGGHWTGEVHRPWLVRTLRGKGGAT